jgi:hypothetical protein
MYAMRTYFFGKNTKFGIKIIVDFRLLFKARFPSGKFVLNLPITFPNSEVGRELRNEVRKFISKFKL